MGRGGHWGSANVFLLVNLVCFVCALVICLCESKRRRELDCLFMCADAVEGRSLFVAICVTSHVNVLCVRVFSCQCLCLCVCVSGVRALRHYGLNLHTGMRKQYPSAWGETPGLQGTGLGSGS